MTNIISAAKDAIEHHRWVRWLHSLDDTGLQETHDRFVHWRDNPEGDYSLSYDELNSKITVIAAIIASR